MKPLTVDDVRAIARLARLALTDDEQVRLCDELTSILTHMETLQALDTEGVEPMTHAVPMALRVRADEVAASLPVDEAVGQAPDRAGDLFRVPRAVRAPGTPGAPTTKVPR